MAEFRSTGEKRNGLQIEANPPSTTHTIRHRKHLPALQKVGLKANRPSLLGINYQRLASLQEYVLIDQEHPRIEVFHRQGNAWLLSIYEGGSTVELESVGVDIDVNAVYADPRI